MNTLWTRVKSENDTKGLYVGFFTVLIVIVVLIVLSVIKKGRMKKFYNV